MGIGFRLAVAMLVHNDEGGLPELLRRIRAVLALFPSGPHEMSIVDDGSTDHSFENARVGAFTFPQFRAPVGHQRDFG